MNKILKTTVLIITAFLFLVVSSNYTYASEPEMLSMVSSPYKVKESETLKASNVIERRNIDSNIDEKEIRNETIKNHVNYFKILSKALFTSNTYKDNLVFSPLSSYYNMLLMETAATGEAKETIDKYIFSESLNETYNYDESRLVIEKFNQFSASISNSIWLKNDYEYSDEFIENASHNSYTELFNCSFSSNDTKTEMKNWMNYYCKNLFDFSEATKYLSDDNTSCLFINEVFMQEDFVMPFPTSDNYYDSFGNIDRVKYMKESNYFCITEDRDDFIYLRFYVNGSYMIIIFPKEEYLVDHNVQELLLNDEVYECYLTDMTIKEFELNEYILSLPLFTLKSTLDINQALSKLDLYDVLNHGNPFINMTKNTPFTDSISHIVQKAYFKLDNKGFKAAAVTVSHTGCTAPYKGDTLKINHPFAFILERDGIPAFAGIVNNPNKN